MIPTKPRRYLLILSLVFHSVASALTVVPENEVLRRLAERLDGKGDYNERIARRIGNRTVEFEGLISTEGEVQLVKEILSEPGQFSRWILPNINKRPSGGDYLVKILALDLAPQSTNIVVTRLGFELPVFRKEIQCYVNTKVSHRGNALIFSANVDPAAMGTYIESFEAELQFFPRPNGRMWIYAYGQVKFKYWILYEALPDRVLTRETGERLQIVLDNYLNEENRLHLIRKVSSATRERPGAATRERPGAEKQKSRPRKGTRPKK